MYKLALEIATRAHKGQVDKGGVDYIEHPKKVASMLSYEKEKIVALLHDTIEDTDMTIKDLQDYGFSDEIIEAIDILAKKDGVPYFEYLSKVKENSLAKAVKIADITHNMDLSRLPVITKKDVARREKYEKAIKFLHENK